jgi:N-acetylglucosaminyldiphosphoundecaprenol N-acetyl-beta-D-mannosaminyltransferase
LLGAQEEVVSQLARELPERFPGVVIAGYRNGFFNDADHPNIVRDIRASAADLLFVGMPTPFKEVWTDQYRNALNVPVILGVGGSFDVHAGVVKRAPRWMQNIGMEWSWRLMMEPRKMWKRYLVTNAQFIAAVIQQQLANK